MTPLGLSGESVRLEVALEAGEEHLDIFPFALGDDVSVGLGDVAGEVPCARLRGPSGSRSYSLELQPCSDAG